MSKTFYFGKMDQNGQPKFNVPREEILGSIKTVTKYLDNNDELKYKNFIMTIESIEQKRDSDQNKFLFVVYNEIKDYLNDQDAGWTIEAVEKLLQNQFTENQSAYRLIRKVFQILQNRNIDTNDLHQMFKNEFNEGRTTTKKTVSDFKAYTEAVIWFCVEFLNFRFPQRVRLIDTYTENDVPLWLRT